MDWLARWLSIASKRAGASRGCDFGSALPPTYRLSDTFINKPNPTNVVKVLDPP